MYLSCGTRPDIVFAVEQLSKPNVDSKVGHLKAAKQVLRYLKKTMHLGITYRAGEDKIPLYGLEEYADNNYAGDPEDCKSVMEYCFFVNRAVIFWCSKKQQTVPTSIIKAKYIALGHAARESVWIKCFFNKLKIADPINACTLYKDNKASIILTKNVKSQSQTKHIDVQHYYIKELVTNGELVVKWICSTNMLANGFTKTLTVYNFRHYQSLLELSI